MAAWSPHKRPKEPRTLLAGLAIWRVWLMAIIAVTIVWGLLVLLLGTAHAESIEIGQDNQAARELSVPTAISVRWTKSYPRPIQVTLCQTAAELPFDCDQATWNVEQTLVAADGVTFTSRRQDPFWAFAVALLENGHVVLSDPAPVNQAIPGNGIPEHPILEVFSTSSRLAGITGDAIPMIRWDTRNGPRVMRTIECRTSAGQREPMQVLCGSGSGSWEGKPLARRAISGGGWTATHPAIHWFFAALVLEDGRFILSQPTLVNPEDFAQETMLLLRAEVADDKPSYAVGETISYSLYLHNSGPTLPKAPLVSIGTYWSQDTLEIIQRHGPQFEDRDGHAGFEIYYAPEDLAPGSDQLVASITFQVTKPGIVQLATRGSILGFGIQGSFELLRQAK